MTKTINQGIGLWKRIGISALGLWLFCAGWDYITKKQTERLNLFESQPTGIEQRLEQEPEQQTPIEPARQSPLEIKYLEQSVSDTDAPSATPMDIIPKYNSPNQTNTNNLPKRKIKIKHYEQPSDSTNPITPDFLERIINQESKNNPRAVSQKGARGTMQIMKPTWHEVTKELYGKRLSYQQAFNSRINKEVGTAYFLKLDRILTNSLPGYSFMPENEKQKYVAAAYNGGINRLLERQGKIENMPRETRDYVRKIGG